MLINKKELIYLNYNKTTGMIPAIIQHSISGEILMHAYMNQEALEKTLNEKKVTFFSRSKNQLWTKGETSGNFLKVISITSDCDNDTLLILVNPQGPTCHLKTLSCFEPSIIPDYSFFYHLEEILKKRKNTNSSTSYTKTLYAKGTKHIAQKVGEEAVETILAAITKDQNEIINETSDLIYHLMVLLNNLNLNLGNIAIQLRKRYKSKIT